MDNRTALARLHYELICGVIENGACPSNVELANRMGASVMEVEKLLRSLSEIHGVVLHPHAPRPWVVHPFSLTPTLNWVEGKRASWWAPCIWCALGIATLVGGEVSLHTRFAAEGETLTIPVIDGTPIGRDEIVVHFAIPPARAWDNVHEHCSLVLPFRSIKQIEDWSGRHRLPFGQPVPLPQVAQLAKLWYGSHGNPDWHKWTIAEAQEIFHRSGLRSEYWDLDMRAGEY
jgi:hypothetical protein